MSKAAGAALILEIAAGVAAQSSGIGGPLVAAAAIVLVVLTAVYLVVGMTSDSLVGRLRSFVSERRTGAPSGGDEDSCRDYDLDTLECFRRLYGPAVRKRTRRLLKKGMIGVREQRRLNSPGNLEEIERLADRLAEYDDPGYR
jgi:hypothetical protein